MERYRLLGIEHDGRESASARVVSREPNKWGVFPLHTFNSGDEVVLAADAQATIAALQAQHKLARDAWWESVKELESQLTQRTAELEAATRERDEAAKDRDDWITSWRALQRYNERIEAELERVRGELDHAKKMEAVQKEVADNQTWHVQKLRTLIAAHKETKHDTI